MKNMKECYFALVGNTARARAILTNIFTVIRLQAMSKPTIFDQLIGEQLSAVTFVQDYVQLWFDGPGLNVTNPLTVSSSGKEVTSWQSGFRDLLCEQITKIASAIDYRENEALEISFSDGSRLLVSLKPEDYTSPEALYGHGFKENEWFVA